MEHKVAANIKRQLLSDKTKDIVLSDRVEIFVDKYEDEDSFEERYQKYLEELSWGDIKRG